MLIDPNITIVRNDKIEKVARQGYITTGIEEVILNVLDAPMTVNQLVTRLMHIYDVDRETCLDETTEFVSGLIETHLIDVQPK